MLRWKVRKDIYIVTNTTLRGQGVMAPTISGTSSKHKPRGVNPGMAAGREGPLSQTSNIIIAFDSIKA